MNTLSDRYVWGVLRAVPTAQRAELEPEIRALIADAVDAQVARGTAAADAEHAALVELGDPDALAARYTDRTLALIGPRFFPEWRRLLTLLLPIVVPLAVLVTTGVAYASGRPPAELVGAAVSAGVNVAIQTVFWVTLVFAIIERTGEARTGLPAGGTGTPDRLPAVPSAHRGGANPVELAFSIVLLVGAAAALVWQQVASPISIDGSAYPLFDPALWSFWLPWFLTIIGVEVVFTFARWRAGGWTWVLAGVNVLLNVGVAVPAVWLLHNGLLLDPALLAQIDRMSGSAWLEPTLAVTAVGVAATAAWDAFDGLRQAYRNQRAPFA